MKKNKKIRKVDFEKVKQFKKDTGSNLDLLSLNFLFSRGVDTKEKYRKFFDYSANDIPDITEYQDGEKAVNRILAAVENNDKILIYGDYDADGITSTSIMIHTLKQLGVETVDYYINNRYKYGFGLKKEGIDESLAKKDYDLFITVDNGVDRVDEAKYLKSKNKDLIITDHHEPLDTGEIPDAIAVVDAHRYDETANFKDMCGAGLALLIMLHVYSRAKQISINEVVKLDVFKHNFALAAQGTVADMMPLHDYNRYVVKKGLSVLNETQECHPSWAALKRYAYKKVINEDTLGWSYGPMINGLSRMTGQVDFAVNLFTAENLEQANEYVAKLDAINNERKELTKIQTEKASCDIIANDRQNSPANIIYGEYNEGIAGIIAGNIASDTSKFTVVLGYNKETNIYKGSVRSPEWINAKQLLDGCKELLASYGGHAGAAGVSISKENIEPFINYVDKTISEMDIPDEVDEYIDFKLTPNKITVDFIKNMEKMAPFGVGFESPKYVILGCVTKTNSLSTKTGKAAKLILDYNVECIWWKKFDQWEEMSLSADFPHTTTGQETVQVYGELGVNVFRDKIIPQVIVNEIKPWNALDLGVKIKVGLSSVHYSM